MHKDNITAVEEVLFVNLMMSVLFFAMLVAWSALFGAFCLQIEVEGIILRKLCLLSCCVFVCLIERCLVNITD